MPNPFNWLVMEMTTDILTASGVRNIFTTIFLVLNFLIAFIGERLIMRQGQRQLLGKKTLPITDLSPFMSVMSTLKHFWILHRLPGGLFGLLMIASGVFGLTGRFLINSFVDADLVAARCPFKDGVVTTRESSSALFLPSSAWAASALVLRAQQAAIMYNNSATICDVGIYSKIDKNVTFFCPTAEDILGNWVCASEPSSTITPANRVNDTTIVAYANSSSFLYDFAWATRGRIGKDGGYGDLMAWSVNASGSSPTTLSVRILSAANLTANGPASTSNFQCQLNVTNPTWTPAPINSKLTLTEWAETMLGSLLDVSPDIYGGQMELVLNAITMVTGTSNSMFNASSIGISGSTYGCKKYQTVTQPPLFITVFVLILILLIILAADLFDLVWNAKNKHQQKVASLPIDLIDWQLALAKKLVNDDKITARDLSRCEYSWNEIENTIECKKNEKGAFSSPIDEDKIALTNDAQCTYVWNSNEKTIQCKRRTEGYHAASETPINNSSDVSISKVDAVATSTALSTER
ncbi:hypothetical protein BDZ45DRAFT_424720 [Acephala macrosclerotiorum]|nr:hypothetical protein BDZ45DRAFT_424720 [Acephala macrosclerotiorum]